MTEIHIKFQQGPLQEKVVLLLVKVFKLYDIKVFYVLCCMSISGHHLFNNSPQLLNGKEYFSFIFAYVECNSVLFENKIQQIAFVYCFIFCMNDAIISFCINEVSDTL